MSVWGTSSPVPSLLEPKGWGSQLPGHLSLATLGSQATMSEAHFWQPSLTSSWQPSREPSSRRMSEAHVPQQGGAPECLQHVSLVALPETIVNDE